LDTFVEVVAGEEFGVGVRALFERRLCHYSLEVRRPVNNLRSRSNDCGSKH
jgi:hypothetical protein